MACALMSAGAAVLALGVASPHVDDLEPNALEELSAVLLFVAESTTRGGLVGADPSSPERDVASLRARLYAAWDLVAAGELEDACTAVETVRRRADGDGNPPDLVVGSAVPDLHVRLSAVIAALCLGPQSRQVAPDPSIASGER